MPRAFPELSADALTRVRVIATDVDDTLTTGGKLAASTLGWIERLASRGVELVLASIVAACVLLGTPGCGEPATPELWIYASMYSEVLDALAPKVQAAVPGVRIRWYKAGSEEVAARVTAELAAGTCRADVLMTADVFWYQGLAQDGHLARLPDDVLARVPATLRDPDGRWLTSRVAAMVMGVNERSVPLDRAPRGLSDLVRPEYRGKVVIGDPLRSGTAFVTVAVLARELGWDHYRKLRAGEALVEGGNSAVLRRIETGDRPIGVVLMENLLKAARTGSPARMVVPRDGAIVIPGLLAVTARSRHPREAAEVCRHLLSADGQAQMVQAHVYPVVAGVPGPPGAPPLAEILARGRFPDQAMIRQLATGAEAVKERFVQVMFE